MMRITDMITQRKNTRSFAASHSRVRDALRQDKQSSHHLKHLFPLFVFSQYRKDPKVTILDTFGFSSLFLRYFRRVATFRKSLRPGS